MRLDLKDCRFSGPALPASFVHFDLADELNKRRLLLSAASHEIARGWSQVHGRIRGLSGNVGPLRVVNHVIAPLAAPLGYVNPLRQDTVTTREGQEDGGWLMQSPNGTKLRAWSVGSDASFDAPQRSGRAYRLSLTRSAHRVLLSAQESAGLLTNGAELRLLLADPARPDSHVAIGLNGPDGWAAQNLPPDSFRLMLALASPPGLAALPDILEAGRLNQTRVTKDLRVQARSALENFLQSVLDHPANNEPLRAAKQHGELAATLWQEGLIVIYRLLFLLKLESAVDPTCAFSFASTTLWRNSFSPNRALAPLVRRHLDQRLDTGRMLEDGLRTAFRLFRDGLACSELAIAPLGGALFDAQQTLLLDRLAWGERAVALLLDRLLWARPGTRERERIHYGSLDVEDLGRIYEALLELEPGIAAAPMVRLRRDRLEIVVPADSGVAVLQPKDGAGTRIEQIEAIRSGSFHLRGGRGRKATGSYYTPHAFVRHLVHETLAPQLRRCSPDDEPNPAAILKLKIVDPAMGSGHFLVETCRFLGEALYAACRLCDEQADAAEKAAKSATEPKRSQLQTRAATLRQRVAQLCTTDQTLLAYLPSRATEGRETGLSHNRALAICRRLVAVHCLYGADRNPLAVELAKLALWLESYADGLPLTFLNHRLVVGDSLSGPFFRQLANLPVGGGELESLFSRGVTAQLDAALCAALAGVGVLEAGIGSDAADLLVKQSAKMRLDAAMAPLVCLARAWAGAAMLGAREADDEWLALARAVVETGAWPQSLTSGQRILADAGTPALPWDLIFPEVFHRAGSGGFDVVLGNPPWDIVQQIAKEFLASFDLRILDAPTKREAQVVQQRLLRDPAVSDAFQQYQQDFIRQHRAVNRLYSHQKVDVQGTQTGGKLDIFRVFAERAMQLLNAGGAIGMVVPSSFHANEGATGIRRLYLRESKLESCLSFENIRRQFDINPRMKFALLIARRPGPTRRVRVAFYLDDLARLNDPRRVMQYDIAFLEVSGGGHLTFLELRSTGDLQVARQLFLQHPPLKDWAAAHGVTLGREMNITDDAHRVVPVHRLLHAGRSIQACREVKRLHSAGYLLLHEGKTIQQFDDRWDTGPRYAVPMTALDDKPGWRDNARYFRLALRKIARSTDEYTAIAAFTSPGYVFNDTAPCERTPGHRANATALQLCGLINTHVFDWTLRQRAAATVNLFILAACPVCDLTPTAARFVSHASLRLSCNHAAYAPLWQEQMGSEWRERGRRFGWPAVATVDARRGIRAAMDAIAAEAYGLDRAGYQLILDSFNPDRERNVPALCLAAFDELKALGLNEFCRRHDPYFDVPIVSVPAQPVARVADEEPSRVAIRSGGSRTSKLPLSVWQSPANPA